jgi:RNA polymerase sigma-70 factor (ECF subfamily)
MDPRLAARFDPSDIVQETLMDASRKLSQYLRNPKLPFYPWLRQLAWNRLIDLHRRHVLAGKRSVRRESALDLALPDESVMELASRLISNQASPSAQVVREEVQKRVHGALERLAARDREVLVLRYLEQLSIRDIADVLGIKEGAVNMRQVRALERLRDLLQQDSGALQ